MLPLIEFWPTDVVLCKTQDDATDDTKTLNQQMKMDSLLYLECFGGGDKCDWPFILIVSRIQDMEMQNKQDENQGQNKMKQFPLTKW